jgi:hypothetical protein
MVVLEPLVDSQSNPQVELLVRGDCFGMVMF